MRSYGNVRVSKGMNGVHPRHTRSRLLRAILRGQYQQGRQLLRQDGDEIRRRIDAQRRWVLRLSAVRQLIDL
jgi:hypothetical protein